MIKWRILDLHSFNDLQDKFGKPVAGGGFIDIKYQKNK